MKQFIYFDADANPAASVNAFEVADFIDESTGVADGSKPVVTKATGKLDVSLLDVGAIDHDSLDGYEANEHIDWTQSSGTPIANANIPDALLRDGSRVATGILSYNTDFTFTQDRQLITKAYADSLKAGFTPKGNVRAATTAQLTADVNGTGIGKTITGQTPNITLTVDGITLALNDRVLVKDGVSPATTEDPHVHDGIYELTRIAEIGVTWQLTRATNCDEDSEVVAGIFCTVSEGVDYNDTLWFLATDDPIVVDTTALSFEPFFGPGAYTASHGIEMDAREFKIDEKALGGLGFDGDEVYVNADNLVATGGGIIASGSAPFKDFIIDWATAKGDQKAPKMSDLSSTVSGKGAAWIGVYNPAWSDISPAPDDVQEVLDELLSRTLGTGHKYTLAVNSSKGALMRISGNDGVRPVNISEKFHGIGLLESTGLAAETKTLFYDDQVITGVLSGASAGDRYFWNGTTHQNTSPSGGGAYVWQTGIAKNATDLIVQIKLLKRNAP